MVVMKRVCFLCWAQCGVPGEGVRAPCPPGRRARVLQRNRVKERGRGAAWVPPAEAPVCLSLGSLSPSALASGSEC